MSEKSAIEDLYAATVAEMKVLESQNEFLSQEAERLNTVVVSATNIRAGKMDEFNSAKEEAISMDGILSTQERDDLVRSIDADRLDFAKRADDELAAHQKAFKDKIEEVNAVRTKIREVRGRISVHERILRLRGVLQ